MITTEISLQIINETVNSLHFTDGERSAWVQKQLIPNYDPDWEPGPHTVDAEIPVWLAEKVGWV